MPATAETGIEAESLAKTLRRHDRDRYLMTLFAPAESRATILAIYAFNYEIARVRDTVTEPMLGQIRLQWWRDGIEAAAGDGAVRKHEVLTPLATAIRDHGLSPAHFDRLIDARERDLADEPPGTLPALDSYAEETAAPLQLLVLEALGVDAPDATRAAREGAIAYALLGLLRATPFMALVRRHVLPQASIEETELDLKTLYAGKSSPPLAAIAQQIAERARSHLDAARAIGSDRRAMPALLPAVLAAADLRRLRRARYDVFASSFMRPDPLRSWRLTMAMVRGRY